MSAFAVGHIFVLLGRRLGSSPAATTNFDGRSSVDNQGCSRQRLRRPILLSGVDNQERYENGRQLMVGTEGNETNVCNSIAKQLCKLVHHGDVGGFTSLIFSSLTRDRTP